MIAILLFKKLIGNKYAIIEDGEVTTFDNMGKCLEEGLPLSPTYVNGAVKMNYVSVLSSGKRLEVALFVNDVMTTYTSSMQPQDCVMKAFSSLSPICFLRRNGKQDGVNYNQAIFVMPDTYGGNGLVEMLSLSEV